MTNPAPNTITLSCEEFQKALAQAESIGACKIGVVSVGALGTVGGSMGGGLRGAIVGGLVGAGVGCGLGWMADEGIVAAQVKLAEMISTSPYIPHAFESLVSPARKCAARQ